MDPLTESETRSFVSRRGWVSGIGVQAQTWSSTGDTEDTTHRR